MTEQNSYIEVALPVLKPPTPGLVSLTYIIYTLHFISALTGLMTPAFIVTVFLTGWPSLIALFLTYLKRDDVEGTYLESHFNWTIRTFWFTALFLLIASLAFLTLFLIPFSILMVLVTGGWVLYRIIRGVMVLLNEEPIF